MKFDPNQLSDETQEILYDFIGYVTRTEEELEEEERSGKRKTDVKVFVTENSGYELGTLEEEIEELAKDPGLHKNTQQFIVNHNIREVLLNEEAAYVEIITPDLNRVDQFVFIDDGDYLNIVTAERREWTKKTIERLIEYLPSLERVFLSPADLESIVEGLDGGYISGFTAKYHSYSSDKRISIRFHGGDEGDLETVENEFNAKPTRLEISQRNSPTSVVNSAVAQEGHYSIPNVQPGYEETGVETLDMLSKCLKKQDKQNFKIDVSPDRIQVGAGDATVGFTRLELIETQGDDTDNRSTARRLREDILEHKQQYAFSQWDEGKYEVFDKESKEAFEITVEGTKIRLHAKEGTTSTTFRDFSENLYNNFNSTYSLKKISEEIIA